jgi:hypothetical protein
VIIGFIFDCTHPPIYKSQTLKRILMFCCGPRSGPTACKSGARTVAPDTHVAAGNASRLDTEFFFYIYIIIIGIALAGLLAHHPHEVRSRHRSANLLDPGHLSLPPAHQLDILHGAVN